MNDSHDSADLADLNGDIMSISIEIKNSSNVSALENIHIKYLGKKGILTERLKNLSRLPAKQRPEMGQRLNSFKKQIELMIKNHKTALNENFLSQQLNQEAVDITLPGRGRSLGRLHPITQIRMRLGLYFEKLGFMFAGGPEIEDDFHNFTALNIPLQHPARASHDTFYFPDGRLLRTHTSPVQIRVLQSQKPPIKIIAAGKVYRCDSDLTHTPMFHQIEGLVIDELHQGVSFADLKYLIQDFFKNFFERDLPVRFRPSYFPFTSPSAEADIGCVMCSQQGCRICKNTGWIEVLGCGLVHPNVLKNVDIDPEKYSGYAFGGGIDRLAMLYYGIDDLRLFFENDLRFLKQF